MKHKTESPTFLRRRKFMAVLPVLVLPFATLLFWALGGGTAESTSERTAAQNNGLNLRLPDAYLTDEAPLDKLSYYDKARSDSAKFAQSLRNDLYYEPDTGRPLTGDAHAMILTHRPAGGRPFSAPYQTGSALSRHSAYQDANEAEVYRKIEQLNTLLEKTDARPPVEMDASRPAAPANDPAGPTDIERLRQMMQAMDQTDGEDPEMEQIDGMLEKILDIQHPERIREKTRRESKEKHGQVLPVVSAADDNPVFLMEDESFPSGLPGQANPVRSYRMARMANGFHSLDETAAAADVPNAIEAVIHQTQTLRSGATVKLRLTAGVYVDGVLIPKDHFLYGTASLDGERLQVEIKGIRYGNSLFPVHLSVCDMDGLDGIHVPGAATRDAAKQSAGGLVQGMNLGALDASLGAQAANAGIEAAKSLLGRRARLVQVTVKAGYQVLLRDEKQKQNP